MKRNTSWFGKMIAGLAVVAMMTSFASAALITEFTFATDVSPTTQAADTTTTAMSGEGSFTGAGQYASPDWGRSTSFEGSFFTRGVSTSGAPSWLEFTIKPDTGYTINLSSLSFDFAVTYATSTTSDFGPIGFSLDGGTTSTYLSAASLSGWIVANGNSLTGVPSRTTISTIDSTATFDLSSLGPVTSEHGIRVRLFVRGGVSDFNLLQRYDNFTVMGSVIPEPATLSMIGMIGIAMILRRRIVRG